MTRWTVTRRPLELDGSFVVVRLDCRRGGEHVVVTLEVPRGQHPAGLLELEGQAVPLGFGLDAAPWLLEALLTTPTPLTAEPHPAWPRIDALDELRRAAAALMPPERPCPS